jgi:hypothetical protein
MENIPERGVERACESPVRPRRRWVRRLLLGLLFTAAVLGILVGLARWYLSWQYPYGSSHCCDIQLMFALHEYARDHDGTFPSGEATPEASLSLLYPKYADANLLRGRTVPLEVVEERLNLGKRLTPETCGWHYVEGLTTKDDPRLALCWDKIGLGHDGRRLPDGGHTVVTIGRERRGVSEAEWVDFLREQAELLAKRNPQSRSSTNSHHGP